MWCYLHVNIIINVHMSNKFNNFLGFCCYELEFFIINFKRFCILIQFKILSYISFANTMTPTANKIIVINFIYLKMSYNCYKKYFCVLSLSTQQFIIWCECHLLPLLFFCYVFRASLISIKFTLFYYYKNFHMIVFKQINLIIR